MSTLNMNYELFTFFELVDGVFSKSSKRLTFQSVNHYGK